MVEYDLQLGNGHKCGILRCRFSPLAKARLWNAATGTLIRELQHPWEGPIFAVAFSPDSKTLLTRAADRTARP